MRDVILVFGSGRSGTSWLCETMARPQGYRLLFEPEHDKYVPEGAVLTDRLLIPGREYADVDRFLGKLFRNRIDNNWIAQNSYRKFKMHLWPFLVKKVIVKFVRCNLCMHYMTSRFSMSSVYIFRDPYSTIHSQNRVQFPWLTDLTRFQQQHELCEYVKNNFGFDLLQNGLSSIQRLAVRWAIENILSHKYLSSQIDNTGIIYLNYDKLIGNIDNYKRLLSQLNLQEPHELDMLFRTPSSKTHPQSNILSGKSVKSELLMNESHYNEVKGILDVFQYDEKLSFEFH